MSTPNTSLVKWVADYELQDRQEDTDEPHGGRHGVPVIPLADLTDWVGKMQSAIRHLEQKDHDTKNWCDGCSEAQRLLAQLETHRKEINND